MKKLTDELIEKANEYLNENESESKAELEKYIKKFSPLMLNPN